MTELQITKASDLLQLHHSRKLLILPNIWDVSGARLLQQLGFPAIATASASVAFSNGYADGEQIPFPDLLNLLSKIASSSSLPVTADIESGYAADLGELKKNIQSLLHTGIAGINFEDSAKNYGLVELDLQCERIRAIRSVAEREGIHLVINARTDVFIQPTFDGNRLEEAVRREAAYKDAGADCFYPILCGMEDLKKLNEEIDLPINVLLKKNTLPLLELEQLGIARVSLGPLFFNAAFSRMRSVANNLLDYQSTGIFEEDLFTNEEIGAITRVFPG